jgi:hypothetical protein
MWRPFVMITAIPLYRPLVPIVYLFRECRKPVVGAGQQWGSGPGDPPVRWSASGRVHGGAARGQTPR